MAGQVNTYHVTVTREGRFWVAVVDGLLGGATETRRLADLDIEVRDLISGLTDADPDSFELDFDWESAFSPAVTLAVHRVITARERLREAEQESADAQREAAQTLISAEVSVRDSAWLLRVSPGWVSQLAPSRASQSRTRARRKAARKVPAKRTSVTKSGSDLMLSKANRLLAGTQPRKRVTSERAGR
jgi:hypothetical protein